MFTRLRALARSPDAQLALAALAICLLFGVVLVAPLPVWAGQPVPPPPEDRAAAQPLGWAAAALVVVFVLALCLPFRPYCRALAAAAQAHSNRSSRLVLALTAMLGLVALLIYPRFGSDIFDYAGFERMWVVYADNPLLATPANRPGDWGSHFVWFANQPPAYGPLWAILTWPIIRLAGESAAAVVGGYKLLSAIGYVMCCALVWSIVEPPRRLRALVLFAWSPLVLFEVLGKVHNDILPALSALGVVWLIKRGASQASLAAVVAGGLVKATALALAPLVGLHLWRLDRWRALLPALVGSGVLAALVYAPFWDVPAILVPLAHQTQRVVWSPGSVLIVAGEWLTGTPPTSLVRPLLGLGWLLACGRIMARARLSPPTALAGAGGWLMIASTLLLTTAVFGHYCVPIVALAATAGDRRLERAVLWLSIGGMAAYSVELLGLALGPEWIGSRGYQVVGSLVLLGPAALAMLASLRRPAADIGPAYVPNVPAKGAATGTVRDFSVAPLGCQSIGVRPRDGLRFWLFGRTPRGKSRG